MSPFDYPASALNRRHGPKGYRSARAYQPWLRDEFGFRCVFCLNREQWGRLTGEFDVEHFQPQAQNPELATVYENLFYACSRCNSAKQSHEIPDPGECLNSETVRVHADGQLEPTSTEARRLIERLRLNSPSMTRWRLIWMRNVELAKEYDPEQFARLMQFPDDLPNLSTLRPPEGNSRPEGIEESHFARKNRGELPAIQ